MISGKRHFQIYFLGDVSTTFRAPVSSFISERRQESLAAVINIWWKVTKNVKEYLLEEVLYFYFMLLNIHFRFPIVAISTSYYSYCLFDDVML